MGQPGFFDLQHRYEGLDAKGDPLVAIAASAPFKLSRRKLKTALISERVTSDNGPGIPATERDKVLQRFVRLDPSRASSGAGLGLALVAAIAALHNAELRLADNHPGLLVRLIWPESQIGTASQ